MAARARREPTWDKLSDEALTLGEILQKAGYRTVGVATNPNVSGPFGFRQGFDDFVMLRKRNTAAAVNEVTFEWLGRHAAKLPSSSICTRWSRTIRTFRRWLSASASRPK